MLQSLPSTKFSLFTGDVVEGTNYSRLFDRETF